MLRKQYRLTSSAQIKELQQRGQSWHNPWLVLAKRANDRQQSRFAFSVSRRFGNAVVRNRVRRVIRECIRRRLTLIAAGWDVLLIARLPARGAPTAQIDRAIEDLLRRSRLLVADGPAQPACIPLNQGQESSAGGMCAR